MDHPTLTKNKSFDEFLQDITFDELDEQLVQQDYVLCKSYDIAPLDIVAPTTSSGPHRINDEPMESPTTVDLTTSRYNTKAPLRHGKQPSIPPSRRRDRRRNEDQRERENTKRKMKQADFLRMRSRCFKTEFLLRDHICRIVARVRRERHVDVEAAIASLPEPVRAIIARAEASMRRYREFTGQKHISEQLNRLPSWLPTGYE